MFVRVCVSPPRLLIGTGRRRCIAHWSNVQLTRVELSIPDAAIEIASEKVTASTLPHWSPLRDRDIDERCPLCLEAFSREHLVWDCKRLETVRRATLGRFSDRERWNLARLIWAGSAPFGTFPSWGPRGL